MPRLHFAVDIKAPPEPIFATIVNLTSYHRWLATSNAFAGIRDVAPWPVQIGTTYVDEGPAGTRQGRVLEFDAPTRVVFRQPMRTSGPLNGTIDIDIICTLVPIESGTRVVREVNIAARGVLVLAQPLILPAFRKENQRLLAALKRHMESPLQRAAGE